MQLLLLLSRCGRAQLCATPETAAHQAPPVPGILQARTLEWVALSFSGDLSDSGTELASPALQAVSL